MYRPHFAKNCIVFNVYMFLNGREVMTRLHALKKKQTEKYCGDFPGSPVVKTLFFQCRGHGFDP